ncbi:MAG: hypothetical protein KA249_12955 [Dermatophilaceae bacterium]|nr:hypothetical protein [Dermatophilaceae bacterium]
MAETETWSCWVAFYDDMSSWNVFGTEIECLRYAVEHTMSATELKSGEGRMKALDLDDFGRPLKDA